MAESRALSQWEIDALLNQIPDPGDLDEAALATAQLQGAPAPERQFARLIKAYDFRRPDKFSKEQWHTLQSMHDTFARLVGAAFSSRLRALVSVRLSSIDQGLYEEWQAQVPSQTVCYVLSMAPLDGNIVLEFNRDVAAEVIDRLLGGNGALIDADRELGEIEVTLLRAFSGGIVKALEEMWSVILPTQFEVKDIGLDAGLIQVAGPNDVVITAFFEVSIGSHLGAMSICLPYTVLEPVATQLSTQIWHAAGTRNPQEGRSHRVMEALLQRAPVEAVVQLGDVEVPLRAITELQPGDTLVLDQRADQPIPLMVGERPRFWARPGMVGTHVGALILGAVEEPVYDLTDEELHAAGIGGSRLRALTPGPEPVIDARPADRLNIGIEEAAVG